MNKALSALTVISLLITPSALAEGKTYKAKDFERIEVEGAMSVIYKTAPNTSVFVESSDGDYSDLRLVNRGDTFVVSRKSLNKKRGWMSWGGSSTSISDDGKTVKVNGKKVPAYTVYLTGPALDGVKVAQSSRFESKSINAGDFDASASSSSKIILAGSAVSADLSASSSAEIEAAGFTAGTLRLAASSSGEAAAATNGTGDTTIEASSSGTVTVKSAAPGKFTVSASSGASVDLAGKCSSLDVSASSGADVEAKALTCQNATVSVSSNADVEAYATNTATGNASSGGSASFAGKPATQDVSKSSGGSVSFSD